MANQKFTKFELEEMLAGEIEVHAATRELLAKTKELVESLENRLHKQEQLYAQQSELLTQTQNMFVDVKWERDDLSLRLEQSRGHHEDLRKQRDYFRERLSRALGWIDNAQGNGPDMEGGNSNG